MKASYICWQGDFVRKTSQVFRGKEANWLRVAVHDFVLYYEIYQEDVKHMAILAMLGDILSASNQ